MHGIAGDGLCPAGTVAGCASGEDVVGGPNDVEGGGSVDSVVGKIVLADAVDDVVAVASDAEGDVDVHPAVRNIALAGHECPQRLLVGSRVGRGGLYNPVAVVAVAPAVFVAAAVVVAPVVVVALATVVAPAIFVAPAVVVALAVVLVALLDHSPRR